MTNFSLTVSDLVVISLAVGVVVVDVTVRLYATEVSSGIHEVSTLIVSALASFFGVSRLSLFEAAKKKKKKKQIRKKK